ncbi:MAG TPA: oligopeptide ABC transporter permease [Bacillota bacterium]
MALPEPDVQEIGTLQGHRVEVETWGRIFWRRFRRNRAALVGCAVLLFLIVISVGAPWIAPHDRDFADLTQIERPPSAEHPLGTDQIGRDNLTRLLWAGRISLMVGVIAVGIAITLGTVLGALAGYIGGFVDNVIMRAADIVLAFPALVLLIVLASIMPATIPSHYGTMAVIGFVSWPGVARLVRGEFLSLREREFVEAGRAMGASTRRMMFRHMLPNAVAPLVVAATLGVASAILTESALSFLGLGVQPPLPSWGNMLTDALTWRVLALKPWLWIPPGIMIFVAVMAINLVGDGLRDALDPRLKN